jgi:hypothetical protein
VFTSSAVFPARDTRTDCNFHESATNLNSFLVYYFIWPMVKKKATKSKTMSKTKIKKRAAAPTRRKAVSKATSSEGDEKYKAQYTTRHGSHLTKTTVGVSDTEADIKEEVE